MKFGLARTSFWLCSHILAKRLASDEAQCNPEPTLSSLSGAKRGAIVRSVARLEVYAFHLTQTDDIGKGVGRCWLQARLSHACSCRARLVVTATVANKLYRAEADGRDQTRSFDAKCAC